MPKTLLLADDSVTIQKVVGISFASEDVTLIAVDNGDDAIRRAREERPDVILADVVMPGLNGYEVCEAVKQDPELAHIPVLLLTGTFETFDAERAASVGAAGHIAKPFEAQALVTRVKELFAANRGPAAAPAPAKSDPVPTAVSGAPSQADANADSFDFFDEEIQDAQVIADADPHADVGPSMESSGDSAFDFGEEDLAFDAVPATVTPAPAPTAAGAFRVDAVDPLVDAESEPDAGDFGDSMSLDAELDSDAAEGLDALLDASDDFADDSLAPLDTATSGDEPFDFAFDAAPDSTGPGEPSDLDDLLRVDAQDLAQATMLDPKGASGYDVSSSDLGPPLSFAADDGPEATVLAGMDDSAASLDDADALDLLGDLVPSQFDKPLEARPNLAETVISAAFADDVMEPLSLDPVSMEPISVHEEVDEEPLEAESVELEPPAVIAEPEPSDSARYDTAARAAAVLEQIEPRLREEIHDTLEKIAWESFSDVTDAIVRQSVERIEAIAWEVIPQLAETLIREEIRKLKGEPPE